MKYTLGVILVFFLMTATACEKGTAKKVATAAPETVNTFNELNKGTAPDFILSDLDGDLIGFKDNFAGKVVLVNFWATWCAPCRQEIPDLVRLYEKHEKDGFVVLGISVDNLSREEIRRFADSYSMNFPILTNINGEESFKVGYAFADAAGIRFTGIPTTYLVNRDGQIIASYLGPRSEKFFYNEIKPLL